MKIIDVKQPAAPTILLYGVSGVGKSTLAATMPDPLFLDIEGGLRYIAAKKTEVITDLDTVYADLLEIAKGGVECKTIIIDSLDWLVERMSNRIAGVGYDANGQRVHGLVELDKTLGNNLMDANGGFGKAKEQLGNHIRAKLLPLLTTLNTRGYSIVLIAHAYENEILDADGSTIQKVQPKIDPATIGKKPVAQPAFVEWADNIFYLKNEGGKRVLQVEGDDYILAKNRMGLKEKEYDLSETSLQEILGLKNGQNKAK